MVVLVRGTVVALALVLLAGCAARRPNTAAKVAPPGADATAAAPGSLSEFMQKVRHLSATARPGQQEDELPRLETYDAGLAADLRLVSSEPTAERYRRVGERYHERGVLDMAYRNFNRAIALNARDAGAYEGLARVWRDWGLPQLAVGDAHRATFYAPHSASARNTYGTVMQALGRYEDAGRAYELAARLDPQEAYAVNNLCYLAFVTGEFDRAIETCDKALALDPALAAARNNLALAYAATGRLDLARTHFMDAGDRASGLYNTGIAHLASGDEQSALSAFDAASRARSTFNIARERAQQLRARLRLSSVADRVHSTPGP